MDGTSVYSTQQIKKLVGSQDGGTAQNGGSSAVDISNIKCGFIVGCYETGTVVLYGMVHKNTFTGKWEYTGNTQASHISSISINQNGLFNFTVRSGYGKVNVIAYKIA